MKIEHTVKFHNDKRIWKLLNIEQIPLKNEVITMYTFVCGDEEIRMTAHEVEMNEVRE